MMNKHGGLLHLMLLSVLKFIYNHISIYNMIINNELMYEIILNLHMLNGIVESVDGKLVDFVTSETIVG